MYFSVHHFRGRMPKHRLQLVRAFQRRVFRGYLECARLRSVVVDDQQFLVGRLAQESIVSFVPSDVPLLARPQSSMILAQREQRLHISEYILLLGSAAAGGEGVVRIAREPSREIMPVV